MRDAIYHINWGDGDNTFVIASSEQEAKDRMPDGRDMVNSIVKLDHLYQLIFKAGQKQARWDVGEELCCLIGNTMLEDMAAGKLLGDQLRDYMNQLKE